MPAPIHLDRASARRLRRALAAAVVLVGLALLALLAVALFPWGILASTIQQRLSERFGRPVTIERVRRVDRIGFTPTLAVEGLTIPQPAWAGPGSFLRVNHAQAVVPVWPLLFGRFAPRDVTVTGMRLALVRDANGRTNWSRAGGQKGGGSAPELGALVLHGVEIGYRDAKQDRQFRLAVSSDANSGVRAQGPGRVHDDPVQLAFAAPPIGTHLGQPWPFRATIEGRALAMHARGQMDRPLDTDHMTVDVLARAADLRLIDAVIEAGLFATQPVQLAAHLRRDEPRWTITDLHGRIGRSDISGQLRVDQQDGRNKLDGQVVSRQLDFRDLSSDAGLARGAAREQAIGPRLVPATRIDIGGIDNTDGRLSFRVDRLIGDAAGSLAAMHGTLALDHRVLRVRPLVLRLRQGVVTGSATVDQHDGGPQPTLSLDLSLRGATLPSLVGGEGDFTGAVTGHARLTGRGDTIRAAVGRSTGRIGLVARRGMLPRKYADALGFDAGRALLAGSDSQAALRCMVLGLAVSGGRGRVDPLVVDTSQSQLRGTGNVSFPDETLAIRLTGAPKHGSLLRLPGSAYLTGTIDQPDLVVPHEVKSVGNIFRAIGRAITGHQGPEATDADCDALAAAALR